MVSDTHEVVVDQVYQEHCHPDEHEGQNGPLHPPEAGIEVVVADEDVPKHDASGSSPTHLQNFTRIIFVHVAYGLSRL